jgi:hypothetical protein
MKAGQYCANCHFLMYVMNSYSGGGYPEDSVRTEWRAMIKRGDLSFAQDGKKLKCYHGVWNEEIKTMSDKEKKIEMNDKSRNNSCFFWIYHPEMMIPAAIELQKRKYEIQKTNTAYGFSIVGLLISGFALLANAGIQIYRTCIGR